MPVYELYYSLVLTQESKDKTYDVYTALKNGSAVGITCGLAAVDSGAEGKSKREARFPLKVTDKGVSFRCVEGKASVQKDRERIIKEIGSDTQLLDETLHGVIVGAVLDAALKGTNEKQKLLYLEALKNSPQQCFQLELHSSADTQANVSAVIDALTGKATCETLQLRSELATFIPDSIGQLTMLCELNLSGCTSLVALPDSFPLDDRSSIPTLKKLNLKGCSSLVDLPTSLHCLEEGLILDSGVPAQMLIHNGEVRLDMDHASRLDAVRARENYRASSDLEYARL